MNKYQEALDTIVEKTDILNNTCAFLPKCSKCKVCQISPEDEEMCDDYFRVLLLQELVEKRKPMKPILQSDLDWKCPNCGGYHTKFVQYYCEFCGQKIDWNLNKEENKNENS